MKGSVDQRTQILSKKAVTSAEFSVSPMMWQLFSLILKKFAVISQKHDTVGKNDGKEITVFQKITDDR